MIPKWTPVSVTWLDAHSDYDDCNSVDVAKTYRRAIRKTIGWLIHQDKERIVVAMDDDRGVGDANDIQTVTTVPNAMVLEVTTFKPVKPQKKKTKQ